MLKIEIRKLHSRYKDGTLMYPGEFRFVWCLIGSVWFLIGVEPSTALT